MTAPVSTEFWSAFAVPEGYRAEIIRQELVVTGVPDLTHFRVQMGLLSLFDIYLPAGTEVVSGAEWEVQDDRGVVVMAPRPALLVVRKGAPVGAEPPLLAIEVLAPGDHSLLNAGITRIEGKRLDYADHGLTDYLEIDPTAEFPVASRYELRGGALVEVARAAGDHTLVAERPFHYELDPGELVGP